MRPCGPVPFAVTLPDYVVDVNSVAVFKKRLDKFWADQNVMFDWTADITGTGAHEDK